MITTFEMNNNMKTVIIIGAGASGIAALKACKEYANQIDFICYEKSSHISGIWHFDDDPNRLSVMKSTIMNTAKETSSFSDFLPPANYPTYMPHKLTNKYFENVVEHFDLERHIKLNHEVTDVKKMDDKWMVELKDWKNGQNILKIVDAVFVCTGRANGPVKVSLRGMERFKGILTSDILYITLVKFISPNLNLVLHRSHSTVHSI